MKKQKQIAKWLKGLCICLMIGVVAFTVGISYYILFSGKWMVEDPLHVHIIFSWYVKVLVFAVLYQFWKVCNEIGNDNSFSMENAKSFHLMAMFGVAAAIGYAIRFVFDLIIKVSNFIPLVYAVGMFLASVVFIIVCEALSQLIKNAYEMKLENDLTI